MWSKTKQALESRLEEIKAMDDKVAALVENNKKEWKD